jgi:hypothetical protein
MNRLFSFFLKLFVCFLAAKFVVQALDLDSPAYLLSLTALLLINAYLFEFLVYRERRAPQESPPEAAPTQAPEERP